MDGATPAAGFLDVQLGFVTCGGVVRFLHGRRASRGADSPWASACGARCSSCSRSPCPPIWCPPTWLYPSWLPRSSSSLRRGPAEVRGPPMAEPPPIASAPLASSTHSARGGPSASRCDHATLQDCRGLKSFRHFAEQRGEAFDGGPNEDLLDELGTARRCVGCTVGRRRGATGPAPRQGNSGTRAAASGSMSQGRCEIYSSTPCAALVCRCAVGGASSWKSGSRPPSRCPRRTACGRLRVLAEP